MTKLETLRTSDQTNQKAKKSERHPQIRLMSVCVTHHQKAAVSIIASLHSHTTVQERGCFFWSAEAQESLSKCWGSLHAEPLLLIGPLRRLAVTALQISLLPTALHIITVQLHRGVRGTLLLLHLLHALQRLLVIRIEASDEE